LVHGDENERSAFLEVHAYEMNFVSSRGSFFYLLEHPRRLTHSKQIRPSPQAPRLRSGEIPVQNSKHARFGKIPPLFHPKIFEKTRSAFLVL
jgi:hypothetical protein